MGLYRPLKRNLFKMSKAFEISEALIDLVLRQPLDSLSPELFNIERGHDRPEDHRSSQRALVQLFLTRKVTHQATRKRIASAGRIKNRFERVSRNREILVLREHCGAVLSALYNQRAGSP